MTEALAISLITGAISIIAAAFAVVTGRNNVKDLREIIEALRERVDELEGENHDLKSWAQSLVCQIMEAGLRPAEYLRTSQMRRRKDDQK